ncbi:MAG TPA: peptide chain release factor N(5)-glutamine methyltransferase [Burkholderiales bacterium]|nr:peptide chain release factor N(5)-glutamine methyltransferase [Burkholderiales bacterium]
MSPTVRGLLHEAAAGPDARREAQLLLAHALGVSRSWLIAHDDAPVDAAAAGEYRDLLSRRKAGEPVAYLLGRREFHGLEFRVGPDVLIPRPDTETLVDAALGLAAAHGCRSILDLGTGSGCVAVSLAHELPGAHVCAVDASGAALRVARGNAAAHGVDVEFLEGSWFGPVVGRRFDMIVSNPPYVASGDPHLLEGDLRFEPAAALVGGRDGLEAIRALVADAPAHLRAGGWLLLEHGYDQAGACRDLLAATGFGSLLALRDLAGLPRVAGGALLTPDSPAR